MPEPSSPVSSPIPGFIRRALSGRTRTGAIAQTLLTQVAILGINVFTGIITARRLGPDGRGELAAILLPGVIANAMTLGLPSAATYTFRRYPDARRALFTAAMAMSLVLGVLAALVGVVVVPHWLHQYPARDIRIAQLLILVAPVTITTSVVASILAVEGDFAAANQTRYLVPALTLAGLLACWATKTLTPITAAFAYALPTIPVLLLRIAPLWRQFGPGRGGLRQSARLLLDYGARSYGIDLVGTFSLQVDQALVVAFLSPAAMGTYAVALSASRVLNALQGSIVTVLLPSAAARPASEVVALTARAARVCTALAAPVAAMIAIAGPLAIHVMYGARFAAAVPVFRILLVEVVLGGATWILVQAYMAVGRPGVVTTLQACGLALSVPLMVVLIPRFGLVGAALALLISTSVRLILTVAGYRRLLRVPIPPLLASVDDVLLVWRRLVAADEQLRQEA
jgi:antigen flippase